MTSRPGTAAPSPDADSPTAASVVGGAGWLGAGAGIVKGSQTIVLLALAALLEPSAIGVIAVGSLVLNVTSAVTDLGSSTALVHWRGDAERAARTALTVAVGLSFVITGVVWMAAPWISAQLQTGDSGTGVIRGLMLCLPFTAVAGVSKELLRRDLDFRRRVVPDIVGALAGSALSLGMAATGYGVSSLVAGQLLQAALVMVLCWQMRPVVLPGWRSDDFTGLLAYGGGLAGGNMLTLLMLNVDYLIVAHQLGATDVGVYSMAFRLAYTPYLLIGMVIVGAAFAHLCRLTGPALGTAAGDTAVVVLRLVTPMYVGMLVLAPSLELLGHQWAPGVPALRWLAVYGLLLTVVHVCEIALNAAGRTRDSFLLHAAHLALLTGLLLLWIDGGVTMAGVAQASAAGITLVLAVGLVARRIPGAVVGRLLRDLLPFALGAALLAAVVLVLHWVWPSSDVSLVGLLAVGSAALAAYVLPLALLDRDSLRLSALRGTR